MEAAKRLLSGSIPEVRRPHEVIFIGHGRSKEWFALERFLTKDLRLPCEEFNAKPAAGYTTQQHLEQMLNRATFAFLVMTAEDKHEDGTLHARENVVHEAGLFQGKLGFSNAVLLVEAGCSLPSNFDGLTHIPFPKDNIAGAFHEVRRTLEDRGIIRGI
jgi:predicted nucleotide-binding protein